MVHARAPYLISFARGDLQVLIEAPQLATFEIACYQRERFLVRRVCACRGDDHATGQHACRPAGGDVVVFPLLDHTAVHVDHDDLGCIKDGKNGVAVPGLAGLVQRGAGRVHGGRGGRDGGDGEQYAGQYLVQSAHAPIMPPRGHCMLFQPPHLS